MDPTFTWGEYSIGNKIGNKLFPPQIFMVSWTTNDPQVLPLADARLLPARAGARGGLAAVSRADARRVYAGSDLADAWPAEGPAVVWRKSMWGRDLAEWRWPIIL
jgi:hypothetical protein